MAASAAKESDVGEMIEEAKADFHRQKKQGAFTEDPLVNK
jgi:hypothetical protein